MQGQSENCNIANTLMRINILPNSTLMIDNFIIHVADTKNLLRAGPLHETLDESQNSNKSILNFTCQRTSFGDVLANIFYCKKMNIHA
jgi:hypothetical protein